MHFNNVTEALCFEGTITFSEWDISHEHGMPIYTPLHLSALETLRLAVKNAKGKIPMLAEYWVSEHFIYQEKI